MAARVFPDLQDLYIPLTDTFGRRFASSIFFNMNLSSTSKLSGKGLGNLALSASLVLHVGLIAGFSSWEWAYEVPSKTQQEKIKVKLLPDTIDPNNIQKPIPVNTPQFSPIQPKPVSSNSIPTLITRSPKPTALSHQPEPRARPDHRAHCQAHEEGRARSRPPLQPRTGAGPRIDVLRLAQERAHRAPEGATAPQEGGDGEAQGPREGRAARFSRARTPGRALRP